MDQDPSKRWIHLLYAGIAADIKTRRKE